MIILYKFFIIFKNLGNLFYFSKASKKFIIFFKLIIQMRKLFFK